MGIFRGSCVAIGLALVGVGVGWGQAAAPAVTPLPAFDVVSVKLDKSDSGNTSMNSTSAGIHISGASLLSMVREAYSLEDSTDDLITGLPPWARSERFVIDAKVAEADIPKIKSLTREQAGEMLQTVLVDRFHLVAHRVKVEAPIYKLVVAKHGSKLKASDTAVEAPKGSRVSGCKEGCMSSSNGHLDVKGIPISSFLGFLTMHTGRAVVDATGLQGVYDFSLDWSPNGVHESAEQSGAEAAPELFTALEEQLGLKLEAAKGPVDGLSVDHVEEPSAN
jgi:uncharacterized protein (TIGR03435 family)